jgi:hypothetical protein
MHELAGPEEADLAAALEKREQRCLAGLRSARKANARNL